VVCAVVVNFGHWVSLKAHIPLLQPQYPFFMCFRGLFGQY
jgi:hypothetical protein